MVNFFENVRGLWLYTTYLQCEHVTNEGMQRFGI